MCWVHENDFETHRCAACKKWIAGERALHKDDAYRSHHHAQCNNPERREKAVESGKQAVRELQHRIRPHAKRVKGLQWHMVPSELVE